MHKRRYYSALTLQLCCRYNAALEKANYAALAMKQQASAREDDVIGMAHSSVTNMPCCPGIAEAAAFCLVSICCQVLFPVS